LKNKKVHSLYVEYKFLDVPPEELETPFALPKPKAGGDSIDFNFTKTVNVNTENRRKRLTKALTTTGNDAGDDKSGISGSKESLPATTLGLPDHMVGFILVSEPEDEELDCEEVGVAKIDLRELIKAREDLVEKPVDVFSTEIQSKVSRFLNTGNKPIGTLTLSFKAIDVFKNMNLLIEEEGDSDKQEEDS